MDDLLNLPALNDTLTPDFVDQRSCRQWLALLPMINVPQAHMELLEALDKLNQSSIVPLDRLKTMEMLRDTVAFLTDANAKRYVGRALPLTTVERDIWSGNVKLWLAFACSYKHCLKAALDGDAGVQEFIALANHRCLRYVGLAIREHLMAYQEVPLSLWRELHNMYRIAERGHALRGVKDSLNSQAPASSCAAAYVQALLLDTVKPSGSSVKQIIWLDRLLDRWANYVTVHTELPATSLTRIVVDLEGGGIQHRDVGNSPRLRYLDTSQLAKSLSKRIKLLRMGETPVQLGLGEEFTADVCEPLLVTCFQQWCKGGDERSYQRRKATAIVDIALGMAAIHYFLSGEVFDQPSKPNEVRGQSLEAFQIFGHAGEHSVRTVATGVGFVAERWDVYDQSALGYGLCKRVGEGERLSHNQLLGIRAEEGGDYLLGMTRWIQQMEDGRLLVGVRMLPGIPRAVAVRATGLSPTGNNLFVASLLLPGVAALRSDMSLLLPPSWFRAGRIIEVMHDGKSRRVRMTQLIERGPDFERIAFEAIAQNANG